MGEGRLRGGPKFGDSMRGGAGARATPAVHSGHAECSLCWEPVAKAHIRDSMARESQGNLMGVTCGMASRSGREPRKDREGPGRGPGGLEVLLSIEEHRAEKRLPGGQCGRGGHGVPGLPCPEPMALAPRGLEHVLRAQVTVKANPGAPSLIQDGVGARVGVK